jgi:hypothetical protein
MSPIQQGKKSWGSTTFYFVQFGVIVYELTMKPISRYGLAKKDMEC